jgi:hypothetical protein
MTDAAMDEISPTLVTLLGGIAIGFTIGGVGRISRFCTFCAIREWVEDGTDARAKSWAIAIAIAVIGVQVLHIVGVVDIDQSIYLAGSFGWAGAVAGGLVFGAGMALVGSCGFSLVIRTAAGDLKALMAVIVMALSAYMAARGLTALARVALVDPLAVDASALGGHGLPALIGAATGIGTEIIRVPLAVAVAGGLAIWALKDASNARTMGHALPAIIIGATAIAGFAVTGYLGADEFEPQPLQSVSYIMPTGNAVLYLLTFTGATMDFGIAVILGTLLGSFAASAARRDFSVQSFGSPGESAKVLSGAFLMGFGGVTALGCTFGQGITGVATLSASSVLALVAIVAGAVAVLRLSTASSSRHATGRESAAA